MDEGFVGTLLEEGVKVMPEVWNAAISAITSSAGNVMELVTGSTLLLALTFGFVFLRKAIGLVRRLIRLGGRS